MQESLQGFLLSLVALDLVTCYLQMIACSFAKLIRLNGDI
jgi:hypothetical protein